MVAGVIIWVEPERLRDVPWADWYGPFWVLTFGAVTFTAEIIFANWRRGVLTAMVVTVFLILRLIKLGHWLNLVLLIGLAVMVDSIFTKRRARVTQ